MPNFILIGQPYLEFWLGTIFGGFYKTSKTTGHVGLNHLMTSYHLSAVKVYLGECLSLKSFFLDRTKLKKSPSFQQTFE